jgi:hypothetical protein
MYNPGVYTELAFIVSTFIVFEDMLNVFIIALEFPRLIILMNGSVPIFRDAFISVVELCVGKVVDTNMSS